jgi:predicted ATPase
LLRGARQQLHARIAAVLEERFPETAQTEPELLAHHFTEAGLAERAITHWRRAGERASARSANVEALAHLTKGLGLVAALPDTPRRMEAEFALQTAIGGPLIVTKGYSAPEVEHAYLRAQELGERLGRSGELFPVLRGLWNCYLARAELRKAQALAERLVALAEGEHEDEPLRRALAHRALGSTLFFLGRFYEAAEQLSRGIAFDEAAAATGDGRTSILLYADCPGVVCRAYLSCGQWHLGFPDRAVATMDAGLVLSERLADAHVHVRTLSFAAMLRQWQGNFEAARHWGEAAMAVAREHSIPQWLPMGMMCRGAALARLGQVEEGIAELHAGLADWNRIGSRVFDPMWLSWTAEAHAAAGQIDAAFVALDRAADVAAATSEMFYQAELHRLRGALLIENGEHADAEPWLRRATALAQSQGARSVELRAAMSLARLCCDQGRHTEARDLLAPVYDWFTEGFDTPDLREAKALLDAMRK